MPEQGRRWLRRIHAAFTILALVWIAGAIVMVACRAAYPPVTIHQRIDR